MTDEHQPALRLVPGSIEHLYWMIDAAGTQDVSDIHVVPDQGVLFLTKGVLQRYNDPSVTFSEAHIMKWLEYATSNGGKDVEPLGNRGHTSVAFDTGTWRVRGSFRKTTDGVTVTFRLIPATMPNADQMGVPDSIQQLVFRGSGLVLVEGATGSGKSTLNASLIDKINRELDVHTYLVEDPIEFVHKPIGNSHFTQREIGIHASDFPSAIENALRSKPNVILVGELLNNETKKAALHAATTGHLVFTTAHAGSVTEAIDSFIGEFPAGEQPQVRSRLSQSLLAVVCQKLVPKIGGGLEPAREVMISNLNFAEIISDPTQSKMLHQSIDGTPGSQTLEEDLFRLVMEQKITPEVAWDAARKRDVLKDKFVRAGITYGN